MSNDYNKIPEELKKLKQWIVWSYEYKNEKISLETAKELISQKIKPDKVPYQINGKLAASTRSDEWSNFDDVLSVVASNPALYSGIGFVFSDNDPYSFIDLDSTEGDAIALARQVKIFREFDSYAEVSPSGVGLHIIVKGTVPAGRRRSFIEIYSSNRYATFTGNVYHDVPINDCQDKLTQLWNQMGDGPQTTIYKGADREIYTDQDVIKMAANAVNGDKASKLLAGKWQDDYPSQSEADLALINIIAFYTQSRTQIERIFKNSGLGLRVKANRRDYIDWMINKSFDQMLPPIDFDGFYNQVEEKLANKSTNLQYPNRKEGEANSGSSSLSNTEHQSRPHKTSPHEPQAACGAIKLPPGLTGEIAQFIYAAAPRPVPEIALAGAIGLMAGIVGRAYNISGTGLNQYVLLLADTGTGKEAMASGIDKLMNSIRMQVPTSTTYIGPSEIASGQALIKHLNKVSQCFVSILGEFGLRLQSMSSQHANNAEISLKRALLDLYNKSGHGQVYRPAIYADRDKNVDGTNSPSFSILGESTPERFYGSLNEEMISEGLLPRFMLIEYNGPRPALNKNAVQVEPSFQLLEKFAALVANCETLTHNRTVLNIQSDDEAQKLLDEFDDYATNIINKSEKDIYRQLWNRAHIKALKISGLLAVGVNMIHPVIIPEYVNYAIDLVRFDIRALSEKFEKGLVGSNTLEVRQVHEVVKVIRYYLEESFEKVSKYSPNQKMHLKRVIPYIYLSRRLVSVAAFRNDKLGATASLKRTLKILIDSDRIREIGKQQLANEFNTTQICFMVSDINSIIT